jgi:hypothetical protein
MNTADIDAFIADRKEKAAQLRRDLELFEAETRGMERLRALLLRVQTPVPSASPATASSQPSSGARGLPQEHGADRDRAEAAPPVASEGDAPLPAALSVEAGKNAEAEGGSNSPHNGAGGLSWLRRA